MKQGGKIRNTLLLIGIFLFLAGTGTISSPAMAQTGIVAYYPFNGNANDESGNGNNGTVGGEPFQPLPPIPPPYYTEPLLTEDRFGVPNSAYIFDGNNDFIHVPDNSSLDITGGITLAAWIYPTEQRTQHIVRKGPETNPQAPYELALSGTGAIIFGLNLTTVGSSQVRKEGGYALNQWTFVAGTYDGASMKLYVDGVLVNTIPASGGITQNDSKLLIGTRLNLPADTFKGKLDEIRIYNRALTSDEILQRYISDAYAFIDPTKWADLEFVRRINNGVFESALTRYGSNGYNYLAFSNSGAVSSFQADVTVKAYENNGGVPRAILYGAVYNDGTSGGGQTGDIIGVVGIIHSGTQLWGFYGVSRCTAPNCNLPSEVQSLCSGGFGLGPAVLDQTYPLSFSWNDLSSTFTFGFGGTTINVNKLTNCPLLPNKVTSPKVETKGMGTRIGDIPTGSEGSGFISATFDNVYVNGVAPANKYDEFQTGMIDPTKWRTWEFVRAASGGELISALTQRGVNGSNHISFLDSQAVSEFQADLKVIEFQNSGARPQGRLYAAFYNARTGTSPPGDLTGDVIGIVGILEQGSGPQAFYAVSKCTAPNCNLPGEYDILYSGIFKNVQLNETHRFSLSWNGVDIILGCDGSPILYNPTSLAPVVKLPISRKGIGTRVTEISNSTEWAYVSAQFANIATVVDSDGDGVRDSQDNCPAVYNPIVAQWKDINGVVHNNSQPDFDLDGVGDACDLCPKVANDGGACPATVGAGTLTGIEGHVVTVTFTYNGQNTYLVPPDCNNVVFNSDPPIPQNCRRIPPYVLTVSEGAATPGYGMPGGDWIAAKAGDSWTNICKLEEIFDPTALGEALAKGPVQITPMYTFFETDRGLDAAGNCAGGDICVDTISYNLFQGTMIAHSFTMSNGEANEEVEIDIKPGSYPNTINLGSHGVVPVAILSSATFDARTVKPESVMLAGAHAKLTGKGTPIFSYSDVNGDGRVDLIVHVLTDALQLTPGDTEAVLVGKTTSGFSITGKDTIRIVPAK